MTSLLVAALTIGLLGCGGGSDDGATLAKIPKVAFLKQAEATCIRAYNRVKAGYQAFTRRAPGEPFSTPEEVREYADTVLIPVKRRELGELRALGAPSGDEDRIEALLEAYEEGIATAEGDPHAAVISAFGVFVKATELAERYGLEECRY